LKPIQKSQGTAPAKSLVAAPINYSGCWNENSTGFCGRWSFNWSEIQFPFRLQSWRKISGVYKFVFINGTTE
jgi:hypothetical protein